MHFRDAMTAINMILVIFYHLYIELILVSIATKVWNLLETKNEKPIERSGAKAEVHNGQIYFFGGYTKKDG